MEKIIWNYLKSKGLNDYGVAGLMGNLYAESGLKSNNLQNTYEKKLGMTDEQYTTAVDKGTYTNFIRDSAGYGLAQWTYWSRKQALYNYAKSCKKSIGDLTMQLDFLIKELSKSYKTVLGVLKTCDTVLQASNSVLLQYERPANQGISAQTARAKFGQVYFDKYANQKKGGDKVFLNPYRENVNKLRVTDTYGALRSGKPHKGVDMVSDGDKTIVAIGEGRIGVSIRVLTGLTAEWGNYVRLDLDSGERVYYCHMSQRIARAGQRVKKGDLIGVEGGTGRTDNHYGSHLHLEIRPKGTTPNAINAADFIGIKNVVGKVAVVGQTTAPAAPTTEIKNGDKVKVINTLKSGNRTIGKLYNRGTFTVYYDSYDVLDAKNDRVVIGRGKQVTAAVNVENLMKI